MGTSPISLSRSINKMLVIPTLVLKPDSVGEAEGNADGFLVGSSEGEALGVEGAPVGAEEG
jgi:hypothetical protein